MDRNAAHKNLVLTFLRAFEAGDLSTIERTLDPNFRDWRTIYLEMNRYEFLRALEILFAARQSCAIDLKNIAADGESVAVELTIKMVVGDEEIIMEEHDLYLCEDNLITALHEYGARLA